MSEDIPHDLRWFLQEFGIRDIPIPVEPKKKIEYTVWYPSNKDEEPPF